MCGYTLSQEEVYYNKVKAEFPGSRWPFIRIADRDNSVYDTASSTYLDAAGGGGRDVVFSFFFIASA